MGFAAPLALLGLIAVVVPIIAHLLRRQDVPTRALPTIAFLKRAEAASRRRVRLVDPWLLLARIAMVVLAAMALAAPFFVSTLAWGNGRITSVALVLDDSMSMQADDGAALARAEERAREVIDALPAGSEVALIFAGAPARIAVPRTEDLTLARRAIAAIDGSGARGTELESALALAVSQLGGAKHLERRILVLTDGAEHARMRGLEVSPDIDLEVEVLRESAPPNLAIARARAAADPTVPGHLSVAIQARAFPPSRAPTEPVLVAIEREDMVLGRGELRFVEGIAETLVHVAVLDESRPGARVRLLEHRDAVAHDDTLGVLLRSGAGIQTLLVDGDPRPLARRGALASSEETRFVAQALSALPGGDDGEGLVYRSVDADGFERAGLDDVDVVVLANVDFTRHSLEIRLREFAEQGGILFTAGEHFEREPSAIAELVPARIVSKASGQVTGLVQREPLLPSGSGGLETVRAQERLVMEPKDGAEVVLEWSDGLPALIIDRNRRTAIFGTSVDDGWTDLPYRPAFLPLMTSLLRALAPRGTMPDAPLHPGSSAVLQTPRDVQRTLLIAPNGAVVESTESTVALNELSEPGVWRVRFEGQGQSVDSARSAFVIAAPIEESDLTLGPLPESVLDAPPRENDEREIRRSFAPWVFGLVGLFAVVEGVLRHRRRTRG